MKSYYEPGYHKMQGYQGLFLHQIPYPQVKTVTNRHIKTLLPRNLNVETLSNGFYIQESLLSNDIEPNLSKAQKAFQSLIKNRCEYLDSLTLLPDNWIDGNSDIPNETSIKLGKQILKGCLKCTLDNDYIIPDLIMCPLPTGGVSIEFKKSLDNEIYISINNNGNIDIELMVSGEYLPEELPVKTTKAVITKYGKFIR